MSWSIQTRAICEGNVQFSSRGHAGATYQFVTESSHPFGQVAGIVISLRVRVELELGDVVLHLTVHLGADIDEDSFREVGREVERHG